MKRSVRMLLGLVCVVAVSTMGAAGVVAAPNHPSSHFAGQSISSAQAGGVLGHGSPSLTADGKDAKGPIKHRLAPDRPIGVAPATAGLQLSGTVRNGAAAGIAGISVWVCTQSGLCHHTTTAAGGTYSVGVAANTSYQVDFSDPTGTYGDGYYSTTGFVYSFSSASSFVRVGSTTRTGIDVTLPAALKISGRVTNGLAAGVQGVEVWVSGARPTSGVTDADGNYSIATIPGEHYVFFDDTSGRYPGGYYGTAGFVYDWTAASSVTVAGSSVSGINVTLPAGVRVSGKVTNGASVGLAGITIGSGVKTDADGNYSFAAAPNTSGVVQFTDETGVYASGYYSTGGFVYDSSDADSVAVATTAVSGINVVLPGAVHITGTLKDVTNAGVGSITVSVDRTGGDSYSAVTDADGHFSIVVVPNVDYDIAFDDYQDWNYASGYYDSGASAGFSYAQTAGATVSVGATDKTGVNATLPYDTLITFHVVINGGGPLTYDDFLYTYSRAGEPDGVGVVQDSDTIEAIPDTYTLDMNTAVAGGDPAASWTITNLTCANYGVVGVTMATPPASFAVAAGDDWDCTATILYSPGSTVVGATYHPIAPARYLDTRIGTGWSGKLSAGVPVTFSVGGVGLVPANASAVTGNVTVVNSTNAWAVYLGPDPIASPTSSTINFATGEITANGLTVALSGTGTLSATYMSTTGNTTDLVFDVTGYFTPDATGSTYHPMTPSRLLDTRFGNGLSGKLTANTPRTFNVAGRGGVPANATAVTGNVTVVNSTNAWAVYLGPAPLASPTTSTINFTTGQIKANSLTVSLGSGGTLSATFMSTTGNTTDLVFDVTGYYTADATGARFMPITPARLLDTRFGNGLTGKLVANTPRGFTVAGRGGIPIEATGVTGNVTVVNETNAWAVFLGPNATASPTTSTLNFNTGDIRANGLTVALSPTGTLYATYMSTSGNTTDLVFDATGYFVP